MNNGRAFAAFTHVDELYQAYLTAYLVVEHDGDQVKPHQPLRLLAKPAAVRDLRRARTSRRRWAPSLGRRSTRSGTRNGSSTSATALNPAAASFTSCKTGRGGTIQGHVDQAVLDSLALQQSQLKYGSYLLSQAFPEGSPTHPAYPTGHGTVAGACITVLKFFFDGGAAIPNPMVPSQGWTGARALQRARTPRK